MVSLMRRELPDLPDMFRRVMEVEADWDKWLRVEEVLDEGTLVVRAELPGIDPDKDVDISVANGVLRIRAERQEKSEEKKKDSYRSEFRYGSFARSISLPAGATESDVSASYTDGVLEIRVPVGKDEGPDVVKVPVSRG